MVRWIVTLGGAGAWIAAALLSPSPAGAGPLACSAGSDWNPVEESDVIVAGRISSYELVDPTRTGLYVPVELRMEIERVLKGRIAPGERIVDNTSLWVMTPAETGDGTTRYEWAGAGGACGALDEDPTGWYAVFGLGRVDDGTLRTNRLLTLYLDRRPYDTALIARVRGQIGLPLAGDGTGTRRPSVPWALLYMAVASGAAGSAMAALGYRRRPGPPR